jgi:poly(A) polymerase
MVKRLLEDTPAEEIRPAPLLRGDDLIAHGYSPGPIFKEILQWVEDAQLEGKIHTPTEALSLAVERFPLSRPHKTGNQPSAVSVQQSEKSERGDSRN